MLPFYATSARCSPKKFRPTPRMRCIRGSAIEAVSGPLKYPKSLPLSQNEGSHGHDVGQFGCPGTVSTSRRCGNQSTRIFLRRDSL